MGKKRRNKIDTAAIDLPNSTSIQENNSFSKCLKMFLDEYEIKNFSYFTIKWHKDNLRVFEKTLKNLELPTEPANISEEHIKQSIIYWKKEKNHTPSTINHRIQSCHKLFMFLNKENIISNLPTKNIEKLKTSKVVIKPFSDEQLRLLFRQPDKSTFVGFRDYTFMLILLDTGVRLRELEQMQVPHVNLREKKILVFGKGAKEREVFFQSTTGEYLRRYIIIRGELDHDYLWINCDDTPLKGRNIHQRLKVYGQKANIKNVRVSPHTFRHTCAKKYITKGGDMISLQNLLGHSTLEMVRHYVNLWGADLQRMHKKYSPVEDLFDEQQIK